MSVVGVDGCRAGWLAVRLSRGRDWEAKVFLTFSSVWERHQDASLILVDIPIGLKDRGPEERRCDQEARKILGPRKSSVFPVPCRSAVYQPNYDAAIKENVHLTGKSIFKAVWRIMPKIQEVDELLLNDESARKRVRESHPEVCFWAMNGGQPMAFNKKTEAGLAERQRVLKAILSPIHSDFARWLDAGHAFMRQGVAPDDFLDALVLAATSWLGLAQGLSTLPAEPDRDSHGLPMEMVYARWRAKM